MFLNRLTLTNFKSHKCTSYDFTEKLNLIIGMNGVGKTNILDAIYFLSVFKSSLGVLDAQLVHFDSDFFRLEANFSYDYDMVITYNGKKKVISINQTKLVKFAEFFGHIPLVISSPSDIFLFYGGSEERRKLIDYTISSFDREYLYQLTQYNAYLDQRNAHLKNQEFVDEKLILLYNEKLVEFGILIYSKRVAFMNEFMICIDSWYKQISFSEDTKELKIELFYQSQLHLEDFKGLLTRSFERDKLLKRTTKGIHRDDFDISINKVDIKKIASQGQQKSLLYAIRISQAELISKYKEKQVIFLLDDFSDKLDSNRKRNLIRLIDSIEFISQWFITDTNETQFDSFITKSILRL